MADISKELNQIKNAVYGREVRRSIHDGIDKVNRESEGSRQIANNTEQRQEAVEQQFNTLLGEWSDDKPIDNAETIAARTNTKESKTYENLGKRLDEEYGKVTAQLVQKTKLIDQSYSILEQRRKGKRPIFSFISDDAPIQDYTILKPIIEEKNIPVGIAVITSTINTSGNLSWQQLKELESLGCEVMSHTHQHRDSRTLSEEVLDEDVSTSLRVLRQNGFDPLGFVYPFNSHDANTKRVVQRYFNYSFTKAPLGGDSRGKNYPIIDNQAIGRVALGSYFDQPMDGFPQDTTSLEYYKARVDEAFENENWCVFVLHTWSSDFDTVQQQHLKDVVDYIRSKGGEIVSPLEGFDIYGNTIQLGSGSSRFWVDADNNVLNSYNGLEVVEFNSFSVNNSILDFPNRNITITPITATFAGTEGFPEARNGLLVTQRLFGSFFVSKQEFIISAQTNVGREKIYERFVDSNNEWTSFQLKGELFFDVTTDPFDVGANNTYDLNIAGLDGLRFQDMVTPVPFGTIPNGVGFNLYKTNNDGSITVRFTNPRNSIVNVPTIRWAITCKPR